MNTIVITFDEPSMMLEFMIQLPFENVIYRVAAFESYASVFRGDDEIFSSNTFDFRKALNSYLKMRFQDFEVLDYSNGVF